MTSADTHPLLDAGVLQATPFGDELVDPGDLFPQPLLLLGVMSYAQHRIGAGIDRRADPSVAAPGRAGRKRPQVSREGVFGNALSRVLRMGEVDVVIRHPDLGAVGDQLPTPKDKREAYQTKYSLEWRSQSQSVWSNGCGSGRKGV